MLLTLKKIKKVIFLKLENIFFNINLIKKVYGFFHAIYLIQFLKKKKIKKVTVVYDCKCSPPTYGDYIYFIILIRYLSLFKEKIIFYIINDELRSGWKRLSASGKFLFFRDMKILSNYFLNQNTVEVKFLRWEKFIKIKNDQNPILFKNRVLNRIRIYNFIFNFMHFLSIFDKKNFKKILFKSTPKNYLTIHARYLVKSKLYSSSVSKKRNISVNELKKILFSIRKKYKYKKIIIVTDINGFKYYKNLKKNFSNIIFSKEISSSFLGDAKLILNSKKYFQYNGGGIGIFALFSKIPFLYSFEDHTALNNEFFWIKYSKFTSWQNINQKTKMCSSVDAFVNEII